MPPGMELMLRLEQIRRDPAPKDDANEEYFHPRTVRMTTFSINMILDDDGQPLVETTQLLLAGREEDFVLYLRDYKEPAQGQRYLDLLRYYSPGAANQEPVVWELAEIRDLTSRTEEDERRETPVISLFMLSGGYGGIPGKGLRPKKPECVDCCLIIPPTLKCLGRCNMCV